MARATEDELIARHFAPLAGPGGLSLRDDAALLVPPPGRDLVLTVDACIAGIHFWPDDPPETIGWKALAVNLSDLAAKGADPAGFLLALALPDGWSEDGVKRFAAGLGRLAREAACPLLGGDTVGTGGPLTVSITAVGTVPEGRMVRRTTARPGDVVCVTGTIGDAALGLPLAGGDTPPWSAALSADQHDALVDRYRCPQPRGALAPLLRDLAQAAMDVSDGLAGDLAKMLRASGVGGRLHLDRLPLSAAATAALAADPACLDRIAGGGDDYEILLTLPPGRLDALRREAGHAGIAVTAIGEVTAGEASLATVLNGAPYALATSSFQHF